MWKDTMSVTERKKYKKADGSTGFEETAALEGLPCKLSFVTLRMAAQAGGATETVQIIKVFLAKDVDIKPGSKLTVRRGADVFEFVRSGLPGVYSYHQEIFLAPFKKWA
jgi:hypothetical protein